MSTFEEQFDQCRAESSRHRIHEWRRAGGEVEAGGSATVSTTTSQNNIVQNYCYRQNYQSGPSKNYQEN